MTILYNLEKYEKRNNKYIHTETLLWAQPYSLCKALKTQKEAYKTYFEYLKIVKNGKN
ncbi:hypothetical protein LCGC14_1657460 [marine sediment metagenome]|uniref:Uncharacterized protein n=1 Tax=marine sediment metagenome TaxID=412755 RepID=A0A0F9IHG0_9ZZZZ